MDAALSRFARILGTKLFVVAIIQFTTDALTFFTEVSQGTRVLVVTGYRVDLSVAAVHGVAEIGGARVLVVTIERLRPRLAGPLFAVVVRSAGIAIVAINIGEKEGAFSRVRADPGHAWIVTHAALVHLALAATAVRVATRLPVTIRSACLQILFRRVRILGHVVSGHFNVGAGRHVSAGIRHGTVDNGVGPRCVRILATTRHKCQKPHTCQ